MGRKLIANRTYLTARKPRKKLTSPTRYLVKINALPLDKSDVLDYGCGRGDDADRLGFTKYDPHFLPDESFLLRKWGCIVCHYVLNVVSEREAGEILEKLLDLLTDDGVAYITVRRDIKKEGLRSNGTLQRNVILDLPVLIERKSEFCIYKLTKRG